MGIGVSRWGREMGIGVGNQVLGPVNCLPQYAVACPNASLRPAPTAMACTVGPGLRLAVILRVRCAVPAWSMASGSDDEDLCVRCAVPVSSARVVRIAMAGALRVLPWRLGRRPQGPSGEGAQQLVAVRLRVAVRPGVSLQDLVHAVLVQ